MSEPEVTVRAIPPAATHGLRLGILRPHQTPADMDYPGDHDPATVHFGAYRAGDLVGIASLYREAPPPDFAVLLPDGCAPDDAYRLRGMAVVPALQGEGVGAALLAACLARAAAGGATSVWCNARTPAAGFYTRLGFRLAGGEYDVPGVGPHVFMAIPLG